MGSWSRAAPGLASGAAPPSAPQVKAGLHPLPESARRPGGAAVHRGNLGTSRAPRRGKEGCAPRLLPSSFSSNTGGLWEWFPPIFRRSACRCYMPGRGERGARSAEPDAGAGRGTRGERPAQAATARQPEGAERRAGAGPRPPRPLVPAPRAALARPPRPLCGRRRRPARKPGAPRAAGHRAALLAGCSGRGTGGGAAGEGGGEGGGGGGRGKGRGASAARGTPGREGAAVGSAELSAGWARRNRDPGVGALPARSKRFVSTYYVPGPGLAPYKHRSPSPLNNPTVRNIIVPCFRVREPEVWRERSSQSVLAAKGAPRKPLWALFAIRAGTPAVIHLPVLQKTPFLFMFF